MFPCAIAGFPVLEDNIAEDEDTDAEDGGAVIPIDDPGGGPEGLCLSLSSYSRPGMDSPP